VRATGICRGCEAAKALAGDNSNSHGPAPRFTAPRALSSLIGCNIRRFWKIVFIVQGKPGGTEESVQIIKETRVEAWEAVSDLLDDGMTDVTIVADGRVYTTPEFALTLLDSRD